MIKKVTNRGFRYLDFKDRNNISCSIQESSIATESCIWLGINDADPLVLASKTKEGGTGWVKYPIPDHILMHTRMHLTREQVAELIPILQKFVETGELINE